nr:DoxX family protein [Pseudonocardia sp. C8]
MWIASGILAVIFIGSGLAKSTMSRDRLLATGQSGIAPFPMPVVRLTALCEIAAGIGLFAPWLTGVAPALTPAAAVGLCVVMAGAAISHASLGEPKQVAVNLGLLGVAAFVAAGRLAQLY